MFPRYILPFFLIYINTLPILKDLPNLNNKIYILTILINTCTILITTTFAILSVTLPYPNSVYITSFSAKAFNAQTN